MAQKENVIVQWKDIGSFVGKKAMGEIALIALILVDCRMSYSKQNAVENKFSLKMKNSGTTYVIYQVCNNYFLYVLINFYVCMQDSLFILSWK